MVIHFKYDVKQFVFMKGPVKRTQVDKIRNASQKQLKETEKLDIK